MGTTTCKDEDLPAQALATKKRGGGLYGPMRVVVKSVNKATNGNTMVTFEVADPFRAGPPKTFTEEWDQSNKHIWMDCPSFLDPPPNPFPVVNASGTLYLQQAKYEPELSHAFRPKWPDALRGDEYKELTIMPTSIIVEGFQVLNKYHSVVKIELLSEELASAEQTLTLSLRNGTLTLKLSKTAFNMLNVTYPT